MPLILGARWATDTPHNNHDRFGEDKRMTDRLSRRGFLAGTSALGATACAGGDEITATAAPRDVLNGLDGVGVAARIRAGEITAAEALEASIARAQRLQPQINFMVTDCYDRARAAAARPVSGPFAGVPTLIKDLSNLAGVATGYGCRAFAGNVATSNNAYVGAMLAAGANPIGKSTTPEFGLTATTEPLSSGVTRNPWNTAYSSGGSSGGAAAAVAAGVVPFAHASDGGGSIRVPASACGLVGLKTSRGRLIDDPSSVPLDISVDGVVTHSVRDTAAWLAATEVQGGALARVGMVTGPSQRRLRIKVMVPDGLGRAPHPDVAAAVMQTARTCEGLGHSVRESAAFAQGEALQEAFVLYWAAGAAQTVGNVAQMAQGRPLSDLLEPLTSQLAELWQQQPEGTMERIVGALRGVTGAYQALFADADVLLTPVLAKPPLAIGEIAPTLPFDVGFARVMEYVSYTPLQNVAGAPGISLPLGMSASGLPIGVQVAGAGGDERTLLELAYELELAMPWASRRAALFAG
jgi:amidase